MLPTHRFKINKVYNLQIGSMDQITDLSDICESKYNNHEICLCVYKL